jgi:hypothetical protein
MRKMLAAVFAAMFVVAAGAGSAVAGEVKGPPGPNHGGYTPIENGIAASGCSFNGLNDFEQGQTDRITQNYGTNIQLGLDPAIFGFPGTGCNPAVTPPGLA